MILNGCIEYFRNLIGCILLYGSVPCTVMYSVQWCTGLTWPGLVGPGLDVPKEVVLLSMARWTAVSLK